MNDYFQNVFNNEIVVDVDEVPITTMNSTDHFLYLILHSFKHFTGGGFGVRQVLDILLYERENYSNIEWSYIWKSLKDVYADRFFGDLVYIGNECLGFELPITWKKNCPTELLEDLLSCGAFGNETQEQRSAGFIIKGIAGKKTNSFDMVLKAIFPTKRQLINRYPEIQEKPWLLPIRWFQRLGRVAVYNRNSEGSYAIESLKISKRRIELLKKYDIL